MIWEGTVSTGGDREMPPRDKSHNRTPMSTTGTQRLKNDQILEAIPEMFTFKSKFGVIILRFYYFRV